MAGISLSKAVRSNLLSLQNTSSLMAQTQERLATGNRVNSAMDNPTNFFTAAGLNSRSADLNNLMDSMSNGIKTIEEANNGITSITKLVESAQSTIHQAQSESLAKTAVEIKRPVPTMTSELAGGKAATVLAMGVVGANTAADPGNSTPVAGNIGIMAAAGNINIKLGDATATVALTAADTVGTMITKLNATGLVNASVSSSGELSIRASKAESFQMTTGTNTALGGGFTYDNNGTSTAFAAAEVPPKIEPSATRTKLIAQYNELRTQIGKLAQDAGFNGINLLNGDKLKVSFNEKTGALAADLTISGTKLDASTLGMQEAGTGGIDFQDDAALTTASTSLTDALVNLRDIASNLGSNLAIVQTRQDFTKATINTLQTGAANLTLADSNEEAANMLALQTRQQLSTTALSLASQADQAILRLF